MLYQKVGSKVEPRLKVKLKLYVKVLGSWYVLQARSKLTNDPTDFPWGFFI